MEMRYLKRQAETKWEEESNENICKRYGMRISAMEWVTRNTIKRFGHIRRMKSEELVKKI